VGRNANFSGRAPCPEAPEFCLSLKSSFRWNKRLASKPYIWTPGNDLPDLEFHSRTKHELLQSYLDRYVETLTVNLRQDRLRLTLIDGFAGGGEYRDVHSNLICFGSPILMIQAMQIAETKAKAARSKKPFELDIQYIFVEKNADTVRYLTDLINKQNYPRSLREKISIRAGSFEEHLSDILVAVKRHSTKASRAVFVLDQYGYKDVPFSLIQRIFTELQKPEVILTFATDLFAQLPFRL
jgi:three-Cys-motif partner protein